MLNFKAVPTAQFIAGFPGFSHEFRLAIEFSQLSKRPGCFRSFWSASRVLESLPFGGLYLDGKEVFIKGWKR